MHNEFKTLQNNIEEVTDLNLAGGGFKMNLKLKESDDAYLLEMKTVALEDFKNDM